MYSLRAHRHQNINGVFIWVLDEITYSLRAHRHHNISWVHSNTGQEHILAEGTSIPQHQWSSFKYSMTTHTSWGHMNISRGCSNTGQDHIQAESTSMPWHQLIFKYWTGPRTPWGHTDTTTLVEFSCIWVLDEITYSLRAHRLSSFNYWTRTHTV